MASHEPIRVGPKGRFVLPAYVRKALGVDEGDELIVVVRDGEIVLMNRDQARAVVREAFADGANPVDELIAERHAEAKLEAQGDRPARKRSA